MKVNGWSKDDDDYFGVDPDWKKKGQAEYDATPKCKCGYCGVMTDNTGYGICHNCYNIELTIKNAARDGRLHILHKILAKVIEDGKSSIPATGSSVQSG